MGWGGAGWAKGRFCRAGCAGFAIDWRGRKAGRGGGSICESSHSRFADGEARAGRWAVCESSHGRFADSQARAGRKRIGWRTACGPRRRSCSCGTVGRRDAKSGSLSARGGRTARGADGLSRRGRAQQQAARAAAHGVPKEGGGSGDIARAELLQFPDDAAFHRTLKRPIELVADGFAIAEPRTIAPLALTVSGVIECLAARGCDGAKSRARSVIARYAQPVVSVIFLSMGPTCSPAVPP